jgi:HEAT repeat protein
MAVILIGRMINNHAERRRRELDAYWMQFIFEFIDQAAGKDRSALAALAGDRLEAQKIVRKNDLPVVLYYWNYLQESTKGKTRESLNLFFEESSFEQRIISLLKSRNVKLRILAVNTLGHLRLGSAWNELEKIARDKEPILSISAARALVRISNTDARPIVLPMIVSRSDWSPVLIAKMIQEAGYDDTSIDLVKAVAAAYEDRADDEQMGRLVKYLSLVRAIDYKPLVNRMLAEATGRETLISCLKIVNWPEALPRIRELYCDERWQVRMQVVLTIGRLGQEADIETLIHALNDIEWWVRYRAASALITMPGFTEERVNDLVENHPNAFCRDILSHVVAETELKCLLKPSSFNLSK